MVATVGAVKRVRVLVGPGRMGSDGMYEYEGVSQGWRSNPLALAAFGSEARKSPVDFQSTTLQRSIRQSTRRAEPSRPHLASTLHRLQAGAHPTSPLTRESEDVTLLDGTLS